MIKPKRKRNVQGTKVPLITLNDSTNSPVPDRNSTIVVPADEAALYKQAGNPLGDPHKA